MFFSCASFNWLVQPCHAVRYCPKSSGGKASQDHSCYSMSMLVGDSTIDPSTTKTPRDAGSGSDASLAAVATATLHPDDQLGRLLLIFQDQGCHEAFKKLLTAAKPIIESVAKATLRTRTVDAGNLVDDTLSAVLNHLRRLPAHALRQNTEQPASDQAVQAFTPQPDKPDAGRQYLIWLTQRRAADVARSEHRWGQQQSFTKTTASQLDNAIARQSFAHQHAHTAHRQQQEQLTWLQLACEQLEESEQLLLAMVLEGKTLAVIAHVLDCSEGTASRRRQRIETKLQSMATTAFPEAFRQRPPSAGHEQRRGLRAPAGPHGRAPASRRHAPPEPSAQLNSDDRPE